MKTNKYLFTTSYLSLRATKLWVAFSFMIVMFLGEVFLRSHNNYLRTPSIIHLNICNTKQKQKL